MTNGTSGAGSQDARPLADFVRDVGLAVAEGQRELDQHSLATQLDIDRNAAEGTLPHAFEAPWYRFAEVDVDMKLHVDTEYRTRRGRNDATFFTPRLTVKPPEPDREGAHVDVTSSIHFRLVPVPPSLPAQQERDDESAEDDDSSEEH